MFMLTRQQWLQQRSPIPTLSLSHTHTHSSPIAEASSYHDAHKQSESVEILSRIIPSKFAGKKGLCVNVREAMCDVCVCVMCVNERE